jgi:hypothetical protein
MPIYPSDILKPKRAEGTETGESSRPSPLAKRKFIMPVSSVGTIAPITVEEQAIIEEAEEIRKLSPPEQMAVRKLPVGSPERSAYFEQASEKREPTENELAEMTNWPESKMKAFISKYSSDVQAKIIKKLDELTNHEYNKEQPTEYEIAALMELPLSRAEALIKKYLPIVQEEIRAKWDYYTEHPDSTPVLTEHIPVFHFDLTPSEAREITGQVITTDAKQLFMRMYKNTQLDINEFLQLMHNKYKEMRVG